MKSQSYRYDLDGLRGIAIALVVVFHVFVGKVSGGVDVFLLLSGYFFMGSQLRYASKRSASLNPWWPIWRTMRRLLPAIVVVLLGIVGLVEWLVPTLNRYEIVKQLTASLLYYQNWELASQGADYNIASNTVSPLQHLWSMSVQGQFYLIAIFFALGCGWSVRRQRTKHGRVIDIERLAGPVLVLGTIASFSYATYLHYQDQGLNYYSTWTRLWELSFGAVLLIYFTKIRLNKYLQELCTIIGLAMIFSASILFDGAQVFPGPQALVPLGGAAFVVLGDGRVASWLASKPIRWLGSIAYSLYLWHWPLLIVATVYFDQERPSALLGCCVIALSLLLAHCTYKFVELPLKQHAKRPTRADRRFSKAWTALKSSWAPRWRAVGGCVIVVMMAGMLSIHANWNNRIQAAAHFTLSDENYPGAAALYGAKVPDLPFQPSLDVVAQLPPLPGARGCIASTKADITDVPGINRMEDCTFGDPNGKLTIYVVGGSHSEQYTNVLDPIGKQKSIKIIPLVRQSCPLYVEDPDHMFKQECTDWNQTVLQFIDQNPPDLVFTTVTRPFVEWGGRKDAIPSAFPTLWEWLDERDIPMIGFRDNPWAMEGYNTRRNNVECIANAVDPQNPTECDMKRSDVYADVNPADAELKKYSNMLSVDSSQWICTDTTCPVIIGNVVVYRDNSHLSTAYMATLVPIVWENIKDFIKDVNGGPTTDNWDDIAVDSSPVNPASQAHQVQPPASSPPTPSPTESTPDSGETAPGVDQSQLNLDDGTAPATGSDVSGAEMSVSEEEGSGVTDEELPAGESASAEYPTEPADNSLLTI